MITVLQFLPPLVYSYWMVRGAMSPRPATTADQPAPRTAAAVGLEDDPAYWPADRGAWTAVDERQLIRLLTDSAR